MLNQSLPPGTKGSWRPRDRCTLNHCSWKEQGCSLGHMLSNLGSFCSRILSASLQKSAKGVHHTSCRRSNTVLGLSVWLLIPSRAKNELKRKRKPQPTSIGMPVPLQFKSHGWLGKLNRGIGCCSPPAWAPDHFQTQC